MMTDNEVWELLKRKDKPLNINEAIEIIETKIKWCDEMICNIHNDLKISERCYIEATTLEEALKIVKRVKKYPHDKHSKECNK